MLALRLKDADWQAVLDTNLGAAFRLSRAALRGMVKRRWGRIVNITSIVGVTGNPGQANYAAAKAGLIGMSKALAQEVAARGITVNCVAPGFIDTAMTRVLDEKQREALLGRIPAGRLGEGADIAAGVVYLASDEAGYVTGPDPARQWRHGDDLSGVLAGPARLAKFGAFVYKPPTPRASRLAATREGARDFSDKPKVAERTGDE